MINATKDFIVCNTKADWVNLLSACEAQKLVWYGYEPIEDTDINLFDDKDHTYKGKLHVDIENGKLSFETRGELIISTHYRIWGAPTAYSCNATEVPEDGFGFQDFLDPRGIRKSSICLPDETSITVTAPDEIAKEVLTYFTMKNGYNIKF